MWGICLSIQIFLGLLWRLESFDPLATSINFQYCFLSTESCIVFILKFLFSSVTLRICIVHFRPHRRNEDNNVTITEIRTHTNFSTFKYIFLLSFLGYLTQLFTVLTMHFLPQTDTHTHIQTQISIVPSLSHSLVHSICHLKSQQSERTLFSSRCDSH